MLHNTAGPSELIIEPAAAPVTVMLKVHEFVLPEGSVTENDCSVVPTGKTLPEFKPDVWVRVVEQLSETVGARLTTAPQVPESEGRETLAGQEIAGEIVSNTEITERQESNPPVLSNTKNQIEFAPTSEQEKEL